jgi:hypothetical protein
MDKGRFADPDPIVKRNCLFSVIRADYCFGPGNIYIRTPYHTLEFSLVVNRLNRPVRAHCNHPVYVVKKAMRITGDCLFHQFYVLGRFLNTKAQIRRELAIVGGSKV